MDYQNIFLNNFDKELYLDSLILLTKADKKITQEERNFIDTQANLFDIDIEKKWEKNSNIKDLVRSKNEISNVTKNVIIRDLISLGYIDGNFGQEEREKVYQIAKLLSVDNSQVDKLESWLHEYWELLNKGNQLIGII